MKITDRYVFTFGKYEGELLDDVIKRDPQYVIWCDDEISWFQLDKDLRMSLELDMSDGDFDSCLGDEYWKE